MQLTRISKSVCIDNNTCVRYERETIGTGTRTVLYYTVLMLSFEVRTGCAFLLYLFRMPPLPLRPFRTAPLHTGVRVNRGILVRPFSSSCCPLVHFLCVTPLNMNLKTPHSHSTPPLHALVQCNGARFTRLFCPLQTADVHVPSKRVVVMYI